AGITYALIEQADKASSRFVKAGDRVEDAQVVEVTPQQLVLAEAGHGTVRVPRVDAMAELLRASRPRTTAAGSPAVASPVPAAPGAAAASGAPPVLPPAAGGGSTSTLSVPAAA